MNPYDIDDSPAGVARQAATDLGDLLAQLDEDVAVIRRIANSRLLGTTETFDRFEKLAGQVAKTGRMLVDARTAIAAERSAAITAHLADRADDREVCQVHGPGDDECTPACPYRFNRARS